MDLLVCMIFEEKIVQMVMFYGFFCVVKDELLMLVWDMVLWKDGIGNIDEYMNGNIGWINNFVDSIYDLLYLFYVWVINEVQWWFIECLWFGIFVDFMNEGICGLLYLKVMSFLVQFGVVSMWDKVFVWEIGCVMGCEVWVLGYMNVYLFVFDLVCDLCWGWVIESYGEDFFLVGVLGVE